MQRMNGLFLAVLMLSAVVAPASKAGEAEPTAGALTLRECIERALANNPDVAARGWEVAQSQAQREGAAGRQWPSIHALGTANYFLDNQRLIAARYNGEVGIFGQTILSGDLVLAMPIFTGGQITSRIRATELLQAAAEHRLTRTREELVFNVSSAFFGILAQQRLIESLDFSVRSLERQRKRIQDLIEVSKGVRVDLLRTEVRLANLEQRRTQEQNVMDIQQRVLANLMGRREANGPVAIRGALEFAPMDVVPERLLPSVYERREDYQAARAETAAQERNVAAAQGAHWPQISLRGAYGVRGMVEPEQHPRGLDHPNDAGVIGILIDFPIFEGGQIAARLREEQARLSAAQERLRKLELQIRLEVETAALNVRSAERRILTTGKSVEQAEEGYGIEQDKYNFGKGTIVDVLDAQAALLEAQSTYYRALADLEIAKAQLRLATGGRQ
jgi:outer membrane protein TolC